MSWRSTKAGKHFKIRPRSSGTHVRMSQKGSSMEGMGKLSSKQSLEPPVVQKMPEGKFQDKTGQTNVNWERYVPTYPDGTVSYDNAGFTNTGHGTSCSGCKFYVGGRCQKIRVGGPKGEHPKVEPGNCCDYHVIREDPSLARQSGDAVNVVANENVLSA